MSAKKVKSMQTGVDIEDISRFKGKTLENDEHFLKRVYTKNELDYCFSKKMPEKHLAARFCAKEAVIKALSNILNKKLSYSQIEILNTPNGAPYVNLLEETRDIKISLSLSHDRDKAIAFVIAQEK